jgi:hypothetical protein
MFVRVKDNIINTDGVKHIFKDSFDYPVKYTIGFYYNNKIDVFNVDFNSEEERDLEFDKLAKILILGIVPEGGF